MVKITKRDYGVHAAWVVGLIIGYRSWRAHPIIGALLGGAVSGGLAMYLLPGGADEVATETGGQVAP